MKKKKLLMYAHYYHPDIASTGQILTELAEGMKDSFDITVICTVPSYTGKIHSEYKQKKYYFEEINGIKVIRIRVPEFSKSNKKSRLVNIISYFFGAISATLKLGSQDYIFSISQPPVIGGILGFIGKKLKKAKYIYNIQDFNPEQTIAIGYSNNLTLLKIAKYIDNFSCRQSDKVILVGRDMIDTLNDRFKGRVVPKHEFINNWTDEELIYPIRPSNPSVISFKEKYGIQNKLIIAYSGNIGLYYDLINLLKVIANFKEKDVAFIFIGEGTVKNNLEEYKEKYSLKNVTFIPYQDKKDLIYSLNAADIHWVVNAKGIKGISVPSKLYGVMAAGKAVIGVLEKDSEARLIIEEASCGWVVDPADYDSIEKLLKEVIEKKKNIAQAGMNGRDFIEKKLAKNVSINKYIDVINNL